MPKRKNKSSNKNNNKCPKKCKVEEKSLVSNFADFTLPGFHYLGPGGKKQNGPPTNPIDAIAMKHDEAYDKAIDEFKVTKDIHQVTQEIKVADDKFIEDVIKTEATTAKEVLGKAIGLAGIGIKATVEKALGFTLYPAFDKIKENNSAACTTVVRAGDDFN